MYPTIEITVPAYSLFASLGLFGMMLVIYFRSERMGISFQQLLFLVFLLVAGAGGGSKLMFILTQVPQLVTEFSFTRMLHVIITSGFVFYGGLFGALLGAYFFALYYHFEFTDVADMIAPGFAVFHVFGRIGCFFAGCCYGKEAPWGFALYKEPGVTRIPIQLIESGCILGIVLFLFVIEHRWGKKSRLMESYLFLYSICRFILEFFRGDEIRGIWAGISTSQWISGFIFIGLIIKWIIEILAVRKPLQEQKS